MRTTTLALQIFLLAVEFKFSNGEDYPKDAVICDKSRNNSITLRCESGKTLNIHSATFARFPARADHCTPKIVPHIEDEDRCKEVTRFTRCEGKPVCTIKRQDVKRVLTKCCFEGAPQCEESDALHINYSCDKGFLSSSKGISIIIGVVIAVIIVLIVVCKVIKRKMRPLEDFELGPTTPTPTPSPEEGLATSSKARKLSQRETADVTQMYAEVDKSGKTKAKSGNKCNMNANGKIVNDVMKADDGDVIMSENDDVYESTSHEGNETKLKEYYANHD